MRAGIALLVLLVVLLLALLLALPGCSGDEPSGGGAAAGAESGVDAAARRSAARTPAQRRAVEAQLPGHEASARVSAADIVRLFERRGVRLVVERRSSTLRALSLPTADDEGDPLPDDELQRFGAFTIYVAANGRRLAELGPLGDLVPKAMPDRRGIVWRADSDPLGDTLHTANTFYADGTVMAAWLGGSKRGTDASFRRLDRLLSELE